MSESTTFPRLERIGNHKKYKIIQLGEGDVIVGRDCAANMCIHSFWISRRHAIFRKTDTNDWSITDLNSLNGTCINGIKLEKNIPIILKRDDVVKFGPVEEKTEFTYVYRRDIQKSLPALRAEDSPTKEIFHLKEENRALIESLSQIEEKLKTKEKMQDEISLRVSQLEEEKEKIKQDTIKEISAKEQELRDKICHQREAILNEKKKLEFKMTDEKRRVDKKQLTEANKLMEKLLAGTESTQNRLDEELSQITENHEKHGHLFLEEKSRFLENFNCVIESEFECAICTELFIDAVTINCSHSFCEHCLHTWKSKDHTTCPTCMAEIKTESRSRVLDSFIERILEQLSPSKRKLRKMLTDERKKQAPPRHKKRKRVEPSSNDMDQSVASETTRSLRRNCHCGRGQIHSKDDCPIRKERQKRR